MCVASFLISNVQLAHVSLGCGNMFHLPTLIGLTIILNGIVGVILLSVYWMRRQRCFMFWGASCCVFSLAAATASLRVVIDFPLLTYFVADLLIVAAPILAALGLNSYSQPEQTHTKKLVFTFALTALLLLIFYDFPTAAKLVTSVAVSVIFLYASFLTQSVTNSAQIYVVSLRYLFVLHAFLMTVQSGFLLHQTMAGKSVDLSHPFLYTSLIVHLLITTCTALIFPLLYFIRSEEKLNELALQDPLTGLFNRRGFFLKAEQMLGESLKQDNPLAILMIDLDYFKSVNDKFGHEAGDEALKWVSDKITSQLRTCDISARFGGEEFAVLLLDTDKHTAMLVGERLRASISSTPFTHNGQFIPLSVSIGTSCRRAASCDINSMLGQADRALYQAKSGGRNRLVEAQGSV